MKLSQGFDNRGVSEIIGAILVFGLVVLSLVLFQTNAVPSANEEVEFDHSQSVQADLLGLDAELSDAAASGNGGTAIVTVGTDYPTRFLFRNPPPVSGSLTTENSRFSIANAVAVGNGETDDYWDGAPTTPYESRQLVYRVDYNVYEEAPTTVLSHGVAYSRFPGGTARRIDAGGLIDGRSIELTALDGRRNESRVGAVSVPVTAQSAPTETVRVSDDPDVDGDNIRLTLRTAATATEWQGFLADEMTDGYVEAVEPGTDGTVEVVLEEDQSYDLELARVSLGSAPYTPEPAYVTTTDDTDRAVTVGESTDLTVQVRDQYNGAIAGEDVTFTVDGEQQPPVTTDDDGEATLSYTPSASGPVDVTATVAGGTGTVGDPLSVLYDLTVSTGGGGGTGDGGAGGAEVINRGDQGIHYTSASVAGDKFSVDFESLDGSSYTIREARVSFVSYDAQGKNPITEVENISTDDDSNIIENNESLAVRGNFKQLDPNVVVTETGTQTLVFEFDGEFKSGASRQEFFVVSMLVGDRYQTFFIGETPETATDENSSPGGGNPNQGGGRN